MGRATAQLIELKGTHLNHDFYVVVVKQCHLENI